MICIALLSWSCYLVPLSLGVAEMGEYSSVTKTAHTGTFSWFTHLSRLECGKYNHFVLQQRLGKGKSANKVGIFLTVSCIVVSNIPCGSGIKARSSPGKPRRVQEA